MKEIGELLLPEDAGYTEDHEWLRVEGDEAVIGITDYAQDQLGNIVFVELPLPGDQLARGEEFGTVESVKAVAELYMPVGGEIIAINTALEDSPDLVNTSPHTDGWIIRIRQADPDEVKTLMNRDDYMKMIEGAL